MDFKKIWEEKGFSRDNKIEDTFKYLEQQCLKLNISKNILDLVVSDVFISLSNNTIEFSLDKCRCGCGIDKSGTDVTHYILSKIILINNEITNEYSKIIETKLNNSINEFVKKKKANSILSKVKSWISWR